MTASPLRNTCRWCSDFALAQAVPMSGFVYGQ
jgi:hypothetical protein